MRTIDWSNAIKKDFKRIKASPRHAQDIDQRLGAVVWLCWLMICPCRIAAGITP